MTLDYRIAGFLSEIKFFAVFMGIAIIFRTTAFGMYYIPSESMLPTLAVGDRIVVSKFAYGYSKHSLPFSIGPDFATDTGRVFGKTPDRGDIIVFKHPRTNQTYIKRVIGLPDDIVEIRAGRLLINGQPIERKAQEDLLYREHVGAVTHVRRFRETFGDDEDHEIYKRSDTQFGDNIAPVQIPANNIFVLGDNRDNSLDSRYPIEGVGFLPVENIVGKATALSFSTNRCKKEDGLVCLNRKWFSSLNPKS